MRSRDTADSGGGDDHDRSSVRFVFSLEENKPPSISKDQPQGRLFHNFSLRYVKEELLEEFEGVQMALRQTQQSKQDVYKHWRQHAGLTERGLLSSNSPSTSSGGEEDNAANDA
ncbi:unnamed protein product [Amoebophrya sp. A25]|nr:unnamed protein product [Amoebophrya sp. A25]|eukprot:GSA25T00018243001.1